MSGGSVARTESSATQVGLGIDQIQLSRKSSREEYSQPGRPVPSFPSHLVLVLRTWFCFSVNQCVLDVFRSDLSSHLLERIKITAPNNSPLHWIGPPCSDIWRFLNE